MFERLCELTKYLLFVPYLFAACFTSKPCEACAEGTLKGVVETVKVGSELGSAALQDMEVGYQQMPRNTYDHNRAQREQGRRDDEGSEMQRLYDNYR